VRWRRSLGSEAKVAPQQRGEQLEYMRQCDLPVTAPMETESPDYDLHARAEEVLKDLPEREARIIRMKLGLGCDTEPTLEEVGQVFALTRERFREIEAKALGKLPPRSRHLKDFLEKTRS
jgi:DNA-directed RNA polymerase sigma subunit (sigma70/sigma32)